MQRADWLPEALKVPDTENHIMINVGGLVRPIRSSKLGSNLYIFHKLLPSFMLQMFEAPVSILKRDDKSLLAQLCGERPPVLPDPDGGFFYFDRDW
jgi:hypothetical protein